MNAVAKKIDWIDLSDRPERVLQEDLTAVLPHLGSARSRRMLERLPAYQESKAAIQNLLQGAEFGFYNNEPTTLLPKKYFRAVFWNLSGEVYFHSLLDILRSHPVLRKADIFIFSNTDIGMARTLNRNLVRSLALELSYNYIFSPSYLFLPEAGKVSENQLGLTGQAILTPYPITSYATIAMPPSSDPLRRYPKRIGTEKLLVCRLDLPQLASMHVAATQFDLTSSPHARAKAARFFCDILNKNFSKEALLWSGGFNTTTYISTHAWAQFFSFLNKVIREYDFICEEHHPHPEKFFEKKFFEVMRVYGFHYDDLNEMGRPTVQMPFEDIEVAGHKEKKISHAMVSMLKKFFHKGPNHLSLKVDWFFGNARIRASRYPQAERPKVLGHLYHDKAPISTHDPIVLDFEVG